MHHHTIHHLTCAQRRTRAYWLWSWQPQKSPTPSADCLSSSGPPSQNIDEIWILLKLNINSGIGNIFGLCQLLLFSTKFLWAVDHHQSSSPSAPSASSQPGQDVPLARCSKASSSSAPSRQGCQGGKSPKDDLRWGWHGLINVSILLIKNHPRADKEVQPVLSLLTFCVQ